MSLELEYRGYPWLSPSRDVMVASARKRLYKRFERLYPDIGIPAKGAEFVGFDEERNRWIWRVVNGR